MINEVYNVDCMEFMKDKPDKYFELAIVDPPYGIGDWTQKTENKEKKITKSRFEVKWNDKIPEKKYFDEVLRVSKNQIIWGANYFNCFDKKGGAIVWFKNVKHPNYSKCEIASHSFGVQVNYIDIEWYSLNRSEATIHPCQKPVALYKWLLQNYAKPGDKIVDTHVGSGSHRIASYELGFDFEGTEIDYEIWQAQEDRFKVEKARIDGKFYLPESDLFGDYGETNGKNNT